MSDERDFRVEFRIDVRAQSVNAAILRARDLIEEGEGEVTAVFDENFDEVDGEEKPCLAS